jgi:hypothetical protein
LSPAAIATRLTERFSLLTGGGRNVLPRQRTLEASVAWSHQLLEPDEAIVFRRLSVFAGSFDLAAAVAVVGHGLASADVASLVLRLADRSLIEAVPGGGEPRFRMLETIRHFARQLLVDAMRPRPRRAPQRFDHGPSHGPGLEAGARPRRVDEVDIDNHRSMTWAVESHYADALRDRGIDPVVLIWRGRMAKRSVARTCRRPGHGPLPAAQLDAACHASNCRAPPPATTTRAPLLACLALARELREPGIEGHMLVSWGMHWASAIPGRRTDDRRGPAPRAREPFWAGYASRAWPCASVLGATTWPRPISKP